MNILKHHLKMLRFLFRSFCIRSLNKTKIRKIYDRYEIWKNPVQEYNTIEEENGWSVVIITDGKSNKTLYKSIESISHEFDAWNSEIVIVGPPKLNLINDFDIKIKYVVYHELNIFPGLITHKKNIGVSMCKYDKVVVCHDYIYFEPGWKIGFDKFGDNFDVCMNQVLFSDGRRTRDWIVWDYPGIGPSLLPYDVEMTPYQIISGTYFVVKKRFYMLNPMNNNVRWGEGEDVEWSKRIRPKTKFIMNTHSKVRFLREKRRNEAPYDEYWIENRIKLNELIDKFRIQVSTKEKLEYNE